MIKTSSKVKGFTIIELLVVIGMIGILATMVIFSFSSAQRRARDTSRKSDLGQYRNALETFANNTGGLYPSHASAVAADTLCGASDLNLSIPCPVDVKAATSPYGYRYRSNGTGGITASKYVLYAYLEQSTNYWGLCSAGTTITKASVPVVNDCP